MREFSLDGDDVSVIPEDVMAPDIAEESELLVTLEQTLRDLEDISTRIELDAGVSRGTADALNSIDPTILPETLALESFTQVASMVNLKATVEAIDLKSNWVIGAAVAASFAIIGKIIHWIWTSLSGSKDKGTPSERSEAAAGVVAVIADAKADLIITAKDNDRHLAKKMEEVEKEYMNKLEDSLFEVRNDLMYEVATEGKIMAIIADLSKNFMGLGKAISSSIDDYKRIFVKFQDAQSDDDKAVNLLAGAGMEFPTDKLGNTLRLMGIAGKDEAKTLSGATRLVKEHLDKLISSKTKPTPSASVLLALAKGNNIKDASGYLEAPDEAVMLLKNLNEDVKGVEDLAKHAKTNIHAFDLAAKRLRGNVDALARIHQMVYQVVGVHVKLMENLEKVESHTYVAMTKLAKQSDHADKFTGTLETFDKKIKAKKKFSLFG